MMVPQASGPPSNMFKCQEASTFDFHPQELAEQSCTVSVQDCISCWNIRGSFGRRTGPCRLRQKEISKRQGIPGPKDKAACPSGVETYPKHIRSVQRARSSQQVRHTIFRAAIHLPQGKLLHSDRALRQCPAVLCSLLGAFGGGQSCGSRVRKLDNVTDLRDFWSKPHAPALGVFASIREPASAGLVTGHMDINHSWMRPPVSQGTRKQPCNVAGPLPEEGPSTEGGYGSRDSVKGQKSSSPHGTQTYTVQGLRDM